MDFTLQNWRYAVFHPVFRCDADNTNARPITCTEWLQFCRENNVQPGDFYQSGHGWGNFYTFNQGTIVERGNDGVPYGNGQSWISLADNNIGHDPLTSPTWWETIDDGLGAENDSFASITGIPSMTRVDLAGHHGPAGKMMYHLYTSENGVNAIRLTDQYTQGQFSMGLGSPLPCLAVRMSATDDSCYYGRIEKDEFDFITTTLYKVVNGTVTQIGTAGEYDNSYDLNRQRVYATGNKIGVDVPAGTGNYTDDPIAGATYHTLLEVTDTTLSASTYPYVGIRIDADAGTYLMHEYAGGGFEVHDFTIADITSSTVLENIALVLAGGTFLVNKIFNSSIIDGLSLVEPPGLARTLTGEAILRNLDGSIPEIYTLGGSRWN